MMTLHLAIPIFILASVTALNIAVVKTTFFGVEDNPFTTAYAQSNHSSLSPNELQQQAQACNFKTKLTQIHFL
jgi:hypothetical protein